MNYLKSSIKQIIFDNNIFTILVFWFSLFILSFYFSTNVLLFDYKGGVFWSLLGISFLSVYILTLIFISKYRNRISINYSTMFLILLVLYISIRIIADKSDLYYLKSYTCGFSLYYLLGSTISFLINILSEYSNKYKVIENINYCFFKLYTIFNFILFTYVFIALIPRCQPDYFIIDVMGLYQRPGDLLIVNTFLISICYTMFFYNKKVNNFILITIICYALISSVLIQFIGSNKAFATIVGITFINALYHFFLKKIIKQKELISKTRNIKNITYSLAKFFIKYTLISSVIVVILLFVFYNNYPKMRVFNYNNHLESTSLETRIDIIRYFFIDQFSIAPIQGNMNADNIIYKQGTYPHSFILSLFTHCGLIGFSLFLLYFLLAIFEFYKDLIKQNNDIIIYHKLFIFCLTIIVFLMANLSSFLVWYPAWFTFGFCFPILKIKSKQ